MCARNGNTPRGLRAWWATPPRSGMRLLINPIVYRHLRVCGAMHATGGLAAAGVGFLCLSYAAYGWAAFFLVVAALNLAGGSWYLAIAHSESARG